MYEGILEFQDGTLVSKAKVNISGTIYEVEPEQYSGSTPLSAANLNKMQKNIYNMMHPVGSYYETDNIEFDPNIAWVGTWVLENDGTVLVSKSNEEKSIFNDNIGKVVGYEKHQLTKEELPNYNLSSSGVSWAGGHSGNVAQANSQNQYCQNAWLGEKAINLGGKNQAHSIVQPSKIINRWHRTA